MDSLVDILIIVFYPLIVLLDDLFKEIGKGLLVLLEMYENFITFISEKIFKQK